MVRPSGSRSASFDIVYEFEILPEDKLGNPRIDLEGNLTNEIGIFPGAIEDFQGVFVDTSSVFLLDEGFVENPDDIVNIGDPKSAFAEEFRVGFDDALNELPRQVEIPNPITLDLVSKKSEFDPSVNGFRGTKRSSIEYILTGGGLVGFGINELTLIVEDADGIDENGFQVVVNNEGFAVRDSDFITIRPGFQLSSDDEAPTIDLVNPTPEDLVILETEDLEILQIDTEAAVNDIDYILGDNPFEKSLFSLITIGGISGPSILDPSEILTDIDFIGNATVEPSIEVGEQLIIQAEDLNLHTYQVETLETGHQVISLLNASCNPGTATLNVDDFSITPGTYDLTLSVFDENDGTAQLEVLLNGNPVNAAGNPIILNENTTSGLPTEDVRREFVISGIEINPSDTISIEGTADNSEWARIDFLTFTPSEVS